MRVAAGILVCIWIVICGVALAVVVKEWPSSDGYRFETTNGSAREMLVAVQTYRTLEELQRAGKAHWKDVDTLGGFAHFNSRTKICTIHILDPGLNYQPEVIGHEVSHCLYDEWHPNQL